MIKRILIIAIASVALLFGTTMYAQKPEKKETKEPKGPRIVLEEVEVILKENGKVIDRKRTTKKEKNEIRKKTRSKAIKRTLEKLGIKTYRELREKKLESKLDEEMRKSYSESKIHPPRLKVIDEKGKVLKEISLAYEKTKAKFWDKHKKRNWDGEKIIRKKAAVSENRMFGAVGVNTSVVPIRTPEFDKVYPFFEGGQVSAKLTVHDNRGEVLFEKEYPEGTIIPGYDGEVIVADNGTVAVITGIGEGQERLHVYDRSGKEILVYPGGEGYTFITRLMVSPNGKYLSIKSGGTVFFNTSTRTRWRVDKPYIVSEISNSGIVKAYFRTDPVKIIDLKEHVGE